MIQQAIVAEKKVDVALQNVMFPYLCFYTSNYAMFRDSEKKRDPIQRYFTMGSLIRKFTSDGPECLLYTSSLRISILALK